MKTLNEHTECVRESMSFECYIYIHVCAAVVQEETI